jgi:flagellar motility protein MotE (MotC chaperone)
MKKPARFFRLLPAVIVLGMALLMFKGEGLVREAWAQEQPAAQADATVLAQDTAPLPKDIADDSGSTGSAAEVDVLSALSKRQAQLDAREADLNMRADELAAAENRVDGKIATLKQLQDQIATLLSQRDATQEKQLQSLVKTYAAMKPKDAARIFDNLEDGVLLAVAQEMKSDDLAPILAAMNPDAAQKLTVELANHLKLPALAAPAAPTAAPNQTAAAGTPPAPPAAAPAAGAK